MKPKSLLTTNVSTFHIFKFHKVFTDHPWTALTPVKNYCYTQSRGSGKINKIAIAIANLTVETGVEKMDHEEHFTRLTDGKFCG